MKMSGKIPKVASVLVFVLFVSSGEGGRVKNDDQRALLAKEQVLEHLKPPSPFYTHPHAIDQYSNIYNLFC